MRSTPRSFCGIIVVTLVATGVVGCGGPDVSSPPTAAVEPRQLSTANPADKVIPDSSFYVRGEGWEKTKAKWGEDGVARINELMPKAALKAAESPECDHVEIAGISDQRSEPGVEIVYYVDCRNEHREYVSERDIAESENSLGASSGG
ncbi:hypothetical protein [Lysobacter sp. CA199]|uniref:hypothetical protein n=1 Tax=Lysobacter sp. CA199 TaxID=3455608 RepID=UPI003F8D0211